jgi:hypothetical protein
MPDQPTPEEIARHYISALDSVNLINQLKAKPVLTVDEVDCLKRNKDHLKIMLAKPFWTTENLQPLQDAAI